MIAAVTVDGATPSLSSVFAPGVLAGQVALITGGGTGLGRASALELGRCGATVVIAGRREQVLRTAAEEITSVFNDAPRVEAIAADVRDAGAAERLVSEVVQRHGRLDVLVNNAGGQYFVPAEAIVDKGWQAVWRLNVNATLQMAQAAHAAMAAHGGGMIINVTLSPHHGMPGMAHSGAARAAVEALTKELAERWADDAVAVVAIAAGHFATEAISKYPATVQASVAHSVPLGRMGEPHEHAWLVALLASPTGRALNGSVVTLDGARDNWAGPWPPTGLVDESGQVPAEVRRVPTAGDTASP